MTTWNTVSIDGLSTTGLKIDELEDIYEPYLHDGDGVGGNHWDTPLVHNPNTGKLTRDEDGAYVCGRSKYRVDEIEAWIKVFTLEHPDVTITWSQEWDDDDQGSENTVWRKGELVREESEVNGMIPLDWATLVRDAEHAVARFEEASEGDSGDAEFEAAYALAEITRKLIEGIKQ